MSIRDTVLLFVLAALWGASYLFIRVAVPVLGVFPLVEARLVIGGVILLIYAVIIGRAPNFRKHWRKFLFIGLMNNAIPFTLIATAQLNVTASLAALINATTPLFSALIAAVWISDKLTRVKVIGLFLGIVGVGIIVGWEGLSLDDSRFVSIILLLGASVAYSIVAVYGKRYLSDMNPITVSTGQLMASSTMMLPLALANPPQNPITMEVIGAVIGLGVFSTTVAYLIYFHLIVSAGPTNAASVTLLIPFFSSLWGAIFLGERLLPNELIGFGVILLSLLLVTGLWQRFVFRKPLTTV